MPLLRSEEPVWASLRLEHSRLHQLPKVLHEVWWVNDFKHSSDELITFLNDLVEDWWVLCLVHGFSTRRSTSLTLGKLLVLEPMFYLRKEFHIKINFLSMKHNGQIWYFEYWKYYPTKTRKQFEDDIYQVASWVRIYGLLFWWSIFNIFNICLKIQVCWWKESNRARLWHLWGRWMYTRRQVKFQHEWEWHDWCGIYKADDKSFNDDEEEG